VLLLYRLLTQLDLRVFSLPGFHFCPTIILCCLILCYGGALIQPNGKFEDPAGEKRSNNLTDLLLYLLSGIGLFIFFSSLLNLVTEVGTLVDSSLRFLLNLLFLAGSTIVFGIYRKKITWSQLGLQSNRWRTQFLWIALLLALAINPIRAFVALIVQMFVGSGLEALEGRAEILTAGGFSWPAFLITLIGVGILIPFAEELYFRGLLHNWFAEHFSFWPRVLLSSAVFGLGHFDSIGVVLSSFIMGIVIAIAYERTKTLWLPIAIHAVTNSGAIVLLYLTLAFAA
jgi:uncharacterized protein